LIKEVLNDIMAAEREAGDIIAGAQAAARESVLHSQENAKRRTDERITEEKIKAKELILQKKAYLNNQEEILKQNNEKNYEELLAKAALKMDEAVDFIAERIL
jgi:vacuolar-type H+-ATPase subunit H